MCSPTTLSNVSLLSQQAGKVHKVVTGRMPLTDRNSADFETEHGHGHQGSINHIPLTFA